MINIAIQAVLGFFRNIIWTKFKISLLLNIVLVGAIFFLLRKPDQDPIIKIVTKTITIPGKDGKLDTIYMPQPHYVTNPVNSKLVEEYDALKDSLGKKQAYIDAITQREYNEVYEDSLVKIDVYTKVQGKMLKQAPKYYVKPITVTYTDTIKIPAPKLRNKLLGGVEYGTDIKFSNPVFKGNILLQNKKDNILSVSYDTDKRIWIGYTISF